jgi:hypothetical protein
MNEYDTVEGRMYRYRLFLLFRLQGMGKVGRGSCGSMEYRVRID